jgi:putative two-component system response regulator
MTTSFKTVFIVDNDAPWQEAVKCDLAKHGIHAMPITPSSDIVQLAKNSQPQLIVINAHIKSYQGYHILQALKEDQTTNMLPILLLTKPNNDVDLLAGKGYGATHIIEKPTHHIDLCQHIKQLLAHNAIRILIADDDDIVRDLLTHKLKQQGYRTITTSSGKTVLDLSEHFAPHLLLIDRVMPGIDGDMVVKRLKNQTHTAHIPIIFLSAQNREIDKQDAKKLGVSDYITKPFNIEELLLRIEHVLQPIIE